MNRRKFLKTSSILSGGVITGAGGTLSGLLPGCAPAVAGNIVINPTPLFEISPYLYMQFMEPLGSTEPSVEGSWDYDTNDWRTDFVDCVKDLAPDMIRWGGIFNRYYKWREGIGPVEQRPSMHNYHWEGKETNRVGTHEIVDFCRRVGAEPLLGVNFESDGFQHYKNTVHGENRFGTSEEAADWVSYCNDPTHALRKKNGHAKPFNVKHWQLGNESSYGGDAGFSMDGYLRAAKEFADKMRQRDPSIKLIGWGDVPDCGKLIPGSTLEGNEPWTSQILTKGGDFFDLMAFHMMGIYPRREDTVLRSFNYLDDTAQAWEEMIELGQIPEYRVGIFRNELKKANTNAGLAVTEGHMSLSPYNTNNILRSWLSVAYHARSLNSYLRNADIIKICTAADFNGARWTVNAVMMPEPRGNSFLLPVGHLMKWFNREKGSHGIAIQDAPAELDMAGSRAGKTIYLHVLNKRFNEAVQAEINIQDAQIISGTVYEMAPENPAIHIDQTRPQLFQPEEIAFTPGEKWTFPAASVSILKLKIEN